MTKSTRQESVGPNARNPRKLAVILNVSGGIADVIFKPKGIRLVIFDYDVEGEEHADKDPDGKECCIMEWPASELMVAYENWPIVKAAPTDASACSRQWKCPDCGKVIDHSYEDLVHVGIPICGDCEIDMEMV